MATPDYDTVRQWDAEDPLAAVRAEFELSEDLVYLVGNSLGPLPKVTRQRLEHLLEVEWGRDLVSGWNTHDWFHLPEAAGARIAPLIGAAADEVIVADSTSVNLYKLLLGAFGLRPGRRKLIAERGDFPTNLHVAQAVAGQLPNAELELAEVADLDAHLDADTAVVSLNHINYRSGEVRDMAAITARVHAAGALVLWDLCHSAGAYPVELDAAGADLAVGCGYKYLNGGPGAPAFLYVARRHQPAQEPVIYGWMGHAAPFDFGADYVPHPGIRRNLSGTPPVLGLSALHAGLAVFESIAMQQVREKSKRLTALFLDLTAETAAAHGMTLVSPREAERRGSQVALSHPDGYPIVQALIARGVIGDFRAPSILRFGFAPLYIRYVDVWEAARHLQEVMASGEWRRPEYQQRAAVT